MLCEQSSDQPFPAAHCHFVLAPVRRQRANHESVHVKHYMLSHMRCCLEGKQSPRGIAHHIDTARSTVEH